MNSEKIKQIRAQNAEVRIGKNGITEGIINEIKRRLKDHEVIKIKIGSKDKNRKEIALKIAELANAKLIEVRGYTFILSKIDSD
ncbi:YhbY family RNA-binding protein [Acidianus brierleyi]|uniref:RNA-binding protein n=1 Tax=Acidianus brierleyi TaxID=41673 RepID=A0A2U9IBS4_9CREN|nr:RNA-binding protein [Acidianus brierleyi]